MGVGWKQLLLFSSLVVAGVINAEAKEESLAVELTKWLSSADGGFFNAKQEIRPVNDGSDGGEIFHGIFAKDFIARGELLARIPWQYIVNDEEDDPALYEDDLEEAVLKCGTARNLAKEMNKVLNIGKYMKDPTASSKYGPYIQYLLDQPLGIIPSEWSYKGRAMFQDILGGNRQTIGPSYATTWLEEDWLQDCNGDPKDELGAKAAMLVVARGDDDLLVPVYDMYNHRNGKWYNTKMEVTRGVGYDVTARVDIHPGQQIYNSYNMCDNCGGRKDGYGTPEIFRDYGFIEEFPQRFNFDDYEFLFDLSESEENGEIEVSWGEEFKNDKEKTETKQILIKELQRLVKKRIQLWKSDFKNGKSTIPKSEWDKIWEFHQTMVNALTYAFNDLTEDDDELLPVGKDTCTSDGMCGINYFDDLGFEEDTLKYNAQTCDNKEIMQFPDYYMLEGLKTHYQQLNFAFRKSDGDICMDLEDTVQICSTYRPHYHEYSSHFAARFVDNVKNVVFVGGGDSMMLHEVLKYPNLEKVVGLELDQTVVRKSFKYFRTQAHFDNDKVEWWFGDATKSLLLLPEDYWGSFDLVIVDLSETVMAFSVTEELDVFDALALLLNPEGVMVKNEHYMETMSQTFDYTLQVYLDQNPKICSQCMIFGSNKADFFHKPVVEHGVETLLLPPVEELEDGFDFFHDFRKNNAMEQDKCNLNTAKKKQTVQKKSAGLLHILDAEDVGVTLDKETIEKIILAAAKEEGFTKIEPNADEKLATLQKIITPEDPMSTFVNVAFKEGYASARIWPEDKYVAVDVGVWGAFQNGDKFRQRIGRDLKAETSSFFRVVVGGMFGSSTWKEDSEILGPQIVQQRNCEESKVDDVESADSSAKYSVIDEVLNFVEGETYVVAVLCGVEGGDKCSTLEVLEDHSMISKVVPVYACPDLSGDDDDEAAAFAKMTECEEEILSTLIGGRGLDGPGIGIIVLDESTTYEMGQVLHSILTVGSHQEMLMAKDNTYMMSLSNKSESETWRRNFFDRYRKQLYWDPAKLVAIELNLGGKTMMLDILSDNRDIGFKSYKTLEETLTERLGSESSVEVVAITGGLFNFMHDYDPREYLQEDYPEKPGNEQWEVQKSLGRKTVIQYNLNQDAPIVHMPDLDEFVRIIDLVVKTQGGLYEFAVYTDVGDGAAVVSDFATGSIIATWDGREHVDLSIFLHDDTEFEIKDFLQEFSKLTSKSLSIGLRDDFPRGTGRVMNFQADMTYDGFDSIIDLEPYVELE